MKRLLTIAFVLISLAIHAQEDFRDGYIITTNNDTVYGRIDYQGDADNSTMCRFKDKSDKLTEYYPTEIQSYRFVDSGKFFVSRSVKTENRQKDYFLEYLIKGKLNVYYYRNELGDHYLVDKDTINLIELPPLQKKIVRDDQEYIKNDHTSKSIIEILTKDCPEMATKVNNIYLEQKPLISFASEYHKRVCGDNGCMIYAKKPFPITFFIEPVVGIMKYNIGKIDVYYIDQNGATVSERINISLHPQFGLLIHNWMPRTSEKLFFKTGILVNQVSIKIQNFRMAKNFYRIPFIFEYQYPKGKLRPTFGAGWNILLTSGEGFFGFSTPVDLGLNYTLTDNMQLCATFNSEFSSLLNLMDSEKKFRLESNYLSIGLRIKLQ